ncbi:MAG: tRNA (adenosine(37)-N6)-dimethylallyltransferase MiaA [Balneolales bacterium]
MTHPTVIITGPTATGKTDLSLSLARSFNVPVISADARQCYRYLDIGTGKVSDSILAEIPHYHISTLNPDESFSAADFSVKVRRWSEEIAQKGKFVLVAGGSTLYLESLIRPFDPLPPQNPSNIRELETIAERSGLDEIYKKLVEADPDYACKMHGLNTHRMFRALDVWMQTGRPFSSFHKNQPLTLPDNVLVICLYRERPELHDRINRRVDHMLENGLLQEVRDILNMSYSPDLQSLQTVGYREPIAYFDGQLTYEQMHEKIKRNSRQYARRQLTWFRRWKGVYWLNQSGVSEALIINKVRQLTEYLAAK